LAKNSIQSFQQIRDELNSQFHVSFIGESNSGKTVVAALIKDTFDNYYSEYTKGEYLAWVSEGSTRMNQLLDALLHGKFPDQTKPGDAPPITIEIFSKSGVGGSIKIILSDMAGELRDLFLVREYSKDDERLREIITRHPIKGKPYGETAHIAFAKIYLIFVDCSKFEDWAYQQNLLVDTIKNLRSLKQQVNDTINDKIHNPIGIIFTKYDKLSKAQQLSPEELMDKLRGFKQALAIAHNGPLKYFRMSVETKQLTKKEKDDLIKEKTRDVSSQLETAKNTLLANEKAQKEAKKTVDNTAQEVNSIHEQLTNAQNANQPELISSTTAQLDGATTRLNDAKRVLANITRDVDESKKDIALLQEKLSMLASQSAIISDPPVVPLKYSKDQYIELISWLIDMKKR